MKQRMQGMVMGILVTVLLLGSVTVSAATPRTIEAIFGGVRTTVFGTEFVVRNAEGLVIEPLTYNGIVYVPVNAVLHAMGANAQWNEATSTLNFGLAQGVPSAPTGVRHYLENDIIATQASEHISRFPANGTFVMNGVPYSSGITANLIRGDSATVTYNIEGRGYTRLSGVFGRVGGHINTYGALTITADGVVLSRGDDFLVLSVSPILGDRDGISLPREVSVAIPPGTREVAITIQVPGPAGGLRATYGLGNAFFE